MGGGRLSNAESEILHETRTQNGQTSFAETTNSVANTPEHMRSRRNRICNFRSDEGICTSINEPRVGVAVVSWNNKKNVLRLLQSLIEINYSSYELLVIDNASSDNTVEAIRDHFPSVKIIMNCENLGRTGGLNSGIQYYLQRPQIKYLWLIDNDVIVSPDALSALVQVLETSEKIAVAGSAMYDMSRPTQLIEIGNFISLNKGNIWGNQCFSQSADSDELFYPVDSVSACSMCVRKSAIYEIGLWDRNYFLYFDDVDWNLRFRAQGYQIAAAAKSIIWHIPWEFNKEFTTSYYASRNILYLMSKHLQGLLLHSAILLKEATLLKKSMLALRKHPFYAVVILTAMNDYLAARWGPYRGPDIPCLERRIAKNPYRSWANLLMCFFYLHIVRMVQEGLLVVSQTCKSIAKSFFRLLSDDNRSRIIRWLNGML